LVPYAICVPQSTVVFAGSTKIQLQGGIVLRSMLRVFCVAVAAVVVMTGCSTPAPRYQPLIDNVEVIKRVSGPVALGAFTVRPDMTGAARIGLRGSSMTSPVGSDYAAYLGEAIRQEVELAGKLDPKSQIEISGVLLKNDIDATGISTNSGEIETVFVVKNNGVVRYNKAKRAEASWDSSFLGGVAIPRAIQQYPLIVQKLLVQLLADTDFQAALK
jgi:hypothetical protein